MARKTTLHPGELFQISVVAVGQKNVWSYKQGKASRYQGQRENASCSTSASSLWDCVSAQACPPESVGILHVARCRESKEKYVKIRNEDVHI